MAKRDPSGFVVERLITGLETHLDLFHSHLLVLQPATSP